VEVTATASAEGFCPGESVTLVAPEGFASYEWSNGAETSTTEVTAGGAYSVLVYDDAGCAGFSNLVTVTEIVGNVPTIAVDGDVNLCDGGMLTLTASNADNFIWSTGEESQSIEVTTSGAYAVYSVDICGNDGLSDTLFVEVYDAPLENPTVTPDQTIPAPATVDLSATGENITWYDMAMGGNAVAMGNDFSPMVDATTTYWAEDVRVNGGETQTGGELENQAGGAYHTNSQRWLEFDVHEDIRLNSVTLYANGTYERSFELINEFGMVLESTTQNVTDGTFVLELDWDLEPGNNYGLRCTTDDPQLWREGTDSDLNYPYEVGDLLTVTNSTAGPSLQYYYFFYAWQAEPLPVECASDRVPTTITVEGTSSLEDQGDEAWTVGPNPVNQGQVLTVRGLAIGTPMTVVDVQGRMVFEGAWTGNMQVNWPAGWYTLRVLRGGQAQHQTLVVK
jgi:hypothetical protein